MIKEVAMSLLRSTVFAFVGFLVFSGVPGAGAASTTYPHVKDPHHILEQVDAFEERGSFADSVRCGVILHYEMHLCAKQCEPYTCKERCDGQQTEYLIETRDCTATAVTYYNATSGKAWFTNTADDYKRSSFFRYTLGAPHAGPVTKHGERIGKSYVVLTKATEEDFTLKSGRKLKSIRVFYDYFDYDETLKRYFVDPQAIVFGKFRDTMGLHLEHTFYRLKQPVARVDAITP